MPDIQTTIRAVLGDYSPLAALVADRIYPGEIPDDEAPTPWIYYAIPTSDSVDDLDGDGDFDSDVEFHALADTYAEAVAITNALIGALNGYVGGQITLATWQNTTEGDTDDGYHHAARFRIRARLGLVLAEAGSMTSVVTGADTITLTAGDQVLTLGPDGLELNGETVGEAPDLTPYARKDTAQTFTAAQTITSGGASEIPLTVKGHASQSANLTEWQNSAGTVLTRIGPAGQIFAAQLPPNSSGNAVQFASSDGNSVGFNPSRDFGVVTFQSNHDGGLWWLSTTQNGENPRDITTLARSILLTSTVATHSVIASSQHYTGTASAPHLRLDKWSSTSTARPVAAVDTVWSESTDLTRKGRVIHTVYDTAAREYMRAEADGAAPMLGFLGASAIARPTVSGSRGGNAALASLLTALAALGLVDDTTTA